MGSWTHRVVQGIAILGLAAAPAVALLAPVPEQLLDSAFGSEWMARTVIGLAVLAVASLINFYVGYIVLEGALPGKIQQLGQAVELASSAAGDLREASQEAVARTEQGLTETADQMRSQVSDASEKIRALETRIVDLQTTRLRRRRWRWGLWASDLGGLSMHWRASTGSMERLEEARQTLIDGVVAGAVLLVSLALLPYIDGGGLIVALAFIGILQAADLLARAGRGALALVRRALPYPALRE